MNDPENWTVRKYVSHLPVSDELLMDEGLIPDTRPPVVIPWWRRTRWLIAEKVSDLRLRVGSWIAGVDMTAPYE